MRSSKVGQILASLTAIGVGCALLAGQAAAGGSATAPNPARLTRYHQQVLDWHACGPAGTALDAAGAQCAEVTVPVDYRRPDGLTISVAISRIRATDPARRRGVLLINPGGPGVPGLDQVMLGQLVPDLAASYDLIGMDPRFVGRSTPLHCRWRTDTPLRSAGPDRRSFAQSVAFARDLAAGCAQDRTDLLPYASTRNTARDMDVIRAALGEPRLSYLGVSYGTYLGASYLQLFGAHADRFVLDSAVDPAAAGPALFAAAGPALSAALADWARFAATRDNDFRLGTSTSAVLATVEGIDQAAVRAPLRVGPFQLDAHVVPYLLLAHLGDDSPGAYTALAADVQTLDRAARGSLAVPTDELARFLDGVYAGAGAATDRAGTPVLCADRAVSADPDTYFRDIQAHRATEPLFAPLTRNITPCAFWPVPPAEASTTIHTASTALLVGSTGDPFAPYPGQLAMHRALPGSRLVTLRGAYRHGVYLSDDCVDRAVDTYLTTGVRPARDLDCVSAGGR